MFKHFITIILVITNGFAFAQISTNSPYSSWGVGDVSFSGDAYVNALGGASVALTDSSDANVFNPASYSLTAKQLPLFSLGLNHFEKTFKEGELSSKGRYTGITHMALVIPFAKRYGVAVGLKPFSRVGYEFYNHEKIDGDSIHYLYSGKGGIQEVFLGFSANIIDARKHTLSLGVNGLYYFGAVNNFRRTFKNTNQGETGGMDERILNAKDFSFEIGVNYDYRITPEHGVRVGGTFRPGLDMRFDKRENRVFYGEFNNQNSYDTILNNQLTKGNIHMPMMTKVGVSYRYTPQEDSVRRNRVKLPSYLFTFEYGMYNWGEYKEDFGMSTETNRYVNSNSYRFGFEFVPHRLSASRTSTFIKFYDKIKYRVGAYLVDSPYEIDGSRVQDKGVTLGLGFPIILSRAVSTVNISGSYGVMGPSKSSVGIKESYFGINIGINIAPGYDRWFKKYKYD